MNIWVEFYKYSDNRRNTHAQMKESANWVPPDPNIIRKRFTNIDSVDIRKGISVFFSEKNITEKIFIKPKAGSPIEYITMASLVAKTSPNPNFPLLNNISTIRSDNAMRPNIHNKVRQSINRHENSICRPIFIFDFFAF